MLAQCFNTKEQHYPIDTRKALFIDGNEDNVKIALQVGTQVVYFQSNQKLEMDLKTLGVRRHPS